MKRTNTAVWMEKYQRWQINVQKDGERRSFYSSTPGRNGQREANRKADEWLDDNISDGNAKVSSLFDEYIESLKLTTSQSNWHQQESIGRIWIKPKLGNKKISKLTEQNLQDVINQMHAAGKAKKTMLNLRITLVAFMKYCRRKKATTLFPESLSIPKGARSAEKKILQPEHLKILFNVDTTILKGKRVKDEYINAYRFQVLTGMRPGEILGLEKQDIRDNIVYINRSINVYNEITRGKNANAIRHFALMPKAAEIIREQMKVDTGGNSLFGINSQATYLKRWSRYCESNGIPHITLYELRHTFVSIAKQLPEGQVKSLVGHSANMDTFGTYGHELSGELEKTAKELDSIFSEILKNDNT